ncbi:MAG: anion transporter [Thermodesulfobacteriota bacterium]
MNHSFFILAVFCLVYAGMVLGRLPGLSMDRSGVAVLGAIALVAGGAISGVGARESVDIPTMGLLFGLMVVSAQLRLGGFYTLVTRRITEMGKNPRALLAAVIVSSGVLSALLANDIVCLAMAPILVEGCSRRGLNPLPHLLGLAAGANVGSAALLIGNPQNMLIGQVAGISFAAYAREALPPAILGLFAVYGVLAILYRGRFHAPVREISVPAPHYDAWQSGKGLFILCAALAAFLWGPWPREVSALAAAGVILASRKFATREIFSLIDWHLLLLFSGLFVVNECMRTSGLSQQMMAWLGGKGLDLGRPAPLFLFTVVLSNVVSNVPAVMLLLPEHHSEREAILLALSSTLAGNLFLQGSIANLIVAEQAERLNVRIPFLRHLISGVPITLATLAVAGLWLWLRWDSIPGG